jgi:tetratricopeptide (TPR) repeat protein
MDRMRPIRPRLRLLRRVAAAFVLLEILLLAALAFSGGARAQDRVKGEVSVFTDGGYGRLVFRFDEAVPVEVRAGFPITVLTFKKPVAVAVDRLNIDAKDYVSVARLDPDGSAVRIALKRKVKVNVMPAAERLFVDLLPENWTGVLPGLPQEVIAELSRRAEQAERQLHRQRKKERESTPTVRVRVATQPTFVRYVFDVPEGIGAVPDQKDGVFALNFDGRINWDLADALAALPSTVKMIDAATERDSSTVNFILNGEPKVRSFQEDRAVIVDIGRDGATVMQAVGSPDAAPAQPAVLPGIAAPDTVPAANAAPPHQPKAPPVAPAPPDAAPAQAGPQRHGSVEKKPPETDKPAAEAKGSPPASVSGPKPALAAAPAASAPPAPASSEPRTQKPEPSETRVATGLPLDPKAPVRAEVHKSAAGLRIEFPFVTATPAAIFRRNEMLWLVFDSDAAVDLGRLKSDAGDAVRAASFDRWDGAAVVRLKLARPRVVSVLADGPAWIVDVGSSIVVPTKPLAITRSIADRNRASIAIPFDHAGRVHRIADPVVGDELMVIPGLGPPRGLLKEQDFVELRALPSVQGVVLQPLADDLTADLVAGRITVSRPLGLALSSTAITQQPAGASFRAVTFDMQVWGFDRSAEFNRRQSELVRAAAMAPPEKRRAARLNLARFYLARNMSAEALAVLDVTLADAHGADDVTATVLKAIAEVMFDRPASALKALSGPQIGNQLDAPIWRAVAYARLGKWGEAHSLFNDIESALGTLPIELQRMVLRYALRAAIETRDLNGADKLLNEVRTIGVPDEEAPAVAVLAGRLAESTGRNEDALANYRAAAASKVDRRAAAAGRLHEIMLRYTLGDMQRKEVIDQLESLTTIWRGDETEVEGLKLLAHLYTEEGHYRDAFHVMRTAMLAHPNSDLTRKIQDEAAASFEALFLGGKSDALPPIEALGLFYDYRELTPIGRRGDEMIRKLADRLASVDLLDQAAELLQHQVDHRLHGAARAQVATRLAVIYLMNHKPDRALVTLRTTRADGLTSELREERLLLEARAFSEVGRHELALELIKNIKGREAMRLRADVLWAAHRWREAAEQIELLYGDRWKEFRPLDEGERLDILRAAIGYSMANESISLGRLRERYTAKMVDTPDRHAFEVVSAPTGPEGSEFKDVAQVVSGMNTLEAFLRDMRARYPDAGPVSPQGEGGKSAADGEMTPAASAASRPTQDKSADAKSPARPNRPEVPTGSIPGPAGVIHRSAGPWPTTR